MLDPIGREFVGAEPDGDGEVEIIEGEAVVGHKPVLRAGGEAFTYNSLTNVRQDGGSMRGHFTFVEGTLDAPQSELFECQCAAFPLSRSGDQLRF